MAAFACDRNREEIASIYIDVKQYYYQFNTDSIALNLENGTPRKMQIRPLSNAQLYMRKGLRHQYKSQAKKAIYRIPTKEIAIRGERYLLSTLELCPQRSK